jgi:hypothetical protein
LALAELVVVEIPVIEQGLVINEGPLIEKEPLVEEGLAKELAGA